MGIHFPMGGLGIAREEADSAPDWLPGGVWLGWAVSEALEAFVTSLAGGSVAWAWHNAASAWIAVGYRGSQLTCRLKTSITEENSGLPCLEARFASRGRMKSLRILLADDHDLVRRGLRVLLESHSDWSICAEACTGREAIAKAEEFKPDVIILDITMPELNGIEAARRILEASPSTEILALSAHYSEQLIREIFDSGMHGYIAKSDSDSDLVPAVEALANHKRFFTTRARDVILNNSKSKDGLGAPLIRDERLTSREREIVQLLSEGKNSREVASTLGISVKTTDTHRANIMRKLDLHSVSELVRYAIRNQIIEP